MTLSFVSYQVVLFCLYVYLHHHKTDVTVLYISAIVYTQINMLTEVVLFFPLENEFGEISSGHSPAGYRKKCLVSVIQYTDVEDECT